jgi:hypothetical protein
MYGRKMLSFGARAALASSSSAPSSPRLSTPTSPRSNSSNVEEVVQAELKVEESQVVEETVMRPASNRQIVASVLRTLRVRT